MSTAAALANLLQKKADLNYYTQQQMWYAQKHEDSSAKVAHYEKLQTQWEKAYDDCIGADESKPKTLNGKSYAPNNEAAAKAYADAKVAKFNEEILLEATEEDMEYDQMQAMYNTLCEELRAEIDSDKQLVSNCAQNTHMITS